MYRKFYLTNSEGTVWQLTDQSFKCFLNAPQGLGLNGTLGTTIFGSVGRVDTEAYSFPQVQGELVFCDGSNATRYQQYDNFARFITYTPLILSYVIPTTPAETYTLPCYVTSLTKSESTVENLMFCPVTFQGTDFWSGDEVTVTGTTSFTLNNTGDYPIGFEMTINSTSVGTALKNPDITVEQDSEVYGEAKFISDDDKFTSVYVNSKDAEQNVVLTYDQVTFANPLGYQDLSITNGEIYVTFIKLARGTSTLSVSVASGTVGTSTIKFTPKFRSV